MTKLTQNKPINYHNNERDEMVNFLPENYSSVLEVGCGEGKFRKYLTQNTEYWGIEPDQSAAQIAQKTLNTVLIGEYRQVYEQLPDDFFDLIICNDVIEHMSDEVDFLHSIQHKMTDSGSIVISVPNVRFARNLYNIVVKKDWQYTNAGILDRTHLRFFTQKSIIRTVKSCDFHIEKFSGINAMEFSHNLLKKTVQLLLMSLFKPLLGSDIQYLQFAFQLKKKHKS